MAPSPFPATPWENSSSNSSQAPQKSGMGQGTEQELHPIGMGTTQQGQVPQLMLAPWWLQGPPCVWGHLGVPKATGTGSGCGQGLATPAPGWTSRLHHLCGGMLALLATSTLTAQPHRGCSRCPGVSPSRPHVLEGRGSGPGLRGRELGSAARSGTRSRRASAAARSCAHLDFSRLRSTSLLNQMAKINKYNKSEPPDTNWELTPGLCVS